MIEILKYERVQKGKVIGYVDIKITKWSLIIRRIAHLQSGQKMWFNFPSFSTQSNEGKLFFTPYVELSNDLSSRLLNQLGPLVDSYLDKMGGNASVFDEEGSF